MRIGIPATLTSDVSDRAGRILGLASAGGTTAGILGWTRDEYIYRLTQSQRFRATVSQPAVAAEYARAAIRHATADSGSVLITSVTLEDLGGAVVGLQANFNSADPGGTLVTAVGLNGLAGTQQARITRGSSNSLEDPNLALIQAAANTPTDMLPVGGFLLPISRSLSFRSRTVNTGIYAAIDWIQFSGTV